MSTGYQAYLLERFQGEVFGESLFHHLALLATSETSRCKWHALQQLEKQTKEHIRLELEHQGLNCAEDPGRQQQGKALAERLHSMPWPDLMAQMKGEFSRFVEEFRESESLAPPGKEKLLAYITEHERVLLQFVELELTSPGQDSLAPVYRFLS